MFTQIANSEYCTIPQHILEYDYTYGMFTRVLNGVVAQEEAMRKFKEDAEKDAQKENQTPTPPRM